MWVKESRSVIRHKYTPCLRTYPEGLKSARHRDLARPHLLPQIPNRPHRASEEVSANRRLSKENVVIYTMESYVSAIGNKLTLPQEN